MQVALLSTLEPSTDDPAIPRGLLRLGGRTIVQNQLGTALALGCERVICLADGMPGEVIALQHAVERAGASFQLAADGRTLARLVRPEDELMVLGDGLVAAPGDVAPLLGKGPAVVIQPVESGIAAGYERVDLNHAGGGALRLPGTMVAGLAELPSEWNPVSALLRIAVQSGVRQVALPQDLADSGRWTLIRSDAEAHRHEPRWLRLHTAGAARGGPGAWLAAQLVEGLGPALLHAGTRPVWVAIAASMLALFGLGGAWIGIRTGGFILLGLAWLVRRAAALLARIDREAVGAPAERLRTEMIFGWLIDGCFVLAAVWRCDSDPTLAAMPLMAAFAALVLFGLLRLIPRIFAGRRWAPLFRDRLIAAVALATASFSEVFGLALMAAGLVLLGFALVAAHAAPAAAGPSRLTPP